MAATLNPPITLLPVNLNDPSLINTICIYASPVAKAKCIQSAISNLQQSVTDNHSQLTSLNTNIQTATDQVTLANTNIQNCKNYPPCGGIITGPFGAPIDNTNSPDAQTYRANLVTAQRALDLANSQLKLSLQYIDTANSMIGDTSTSGSLVYQENTIVNSAAYKAAVANGDTGSDFVPPVIPNSTATNTATFTTNEIYVVGAVLLLLFIILLAALLSRPRTRTQAAA